MIKIICCGKLKEKYIHDLVQDYLFRINKYHKIQIIETKDENSLEIEKEHLLKHIKKEDYIIVLDRLGKKATSEEFAKMIDDAFLHSGTITFVIGSSLGIHEDIKKMAKKTVSFSEFTFPHGLFRGILLEQIYRAFKINNNETYHK